MSSETGDEFESDDVVGGSTALFMLCFLLLLCISRNQQSLGASNSF